MFDTIFGLPVHALVIHAVVVLVPLCGVAVVVMAVSARWRERLLVPLVLLLTVALGSTYVAKESGQRLDARLGINNPDLSRHISLGDRAPYIVGLFWLLVVVWLVVDRRRATTDGGSGSGSALVQTLAVLAVVAAVGATTWIVLTGHAGSTAVWRQIVQSTS